MQIESSPFLLVDQKTVVGFMKSAGSSDSDILHTQKKNLDSLAKLPKLAGIYVMVVGGLMTLTILGAFIGIPLLLLGWWMMRRGVKKQTVEAGYARFFSGQPA